MPFQVFEADARSILSPTAGFIAQAGFTHSLTPARNCTFGCSYCYVPTLGVYGGLQPADWRRWGQFTTFKRNAPELLARAVRPEQVIYCSPLTDPYQPAEAERQAMPAILAALCEHPPRVFTIQTRGPLILRDLALLKRLAQRARLRISFSITTDREDIRRIYESGCAPIFERLSAMRRLRDSGIEVVAALAPILPCDPERLAALALESTDGAVIADPLHVRATKKHGATTRDAFARIGARHGHSEWLLPPFQEAILLRLQSAIKAAGRSFAVGPEGFSCLAK